MVDGRIIDLLLAWQERQAQGQDVSAAELCRECPDRTAELDELIHVLRQMPPRSGVTAGRSSLPVASDPTSTGRLEYRPTVNGGPADGLATLDSGCSPADADTDADVSVAPPGYELLGVLGRGGMGVVYRARQTRLNRTVALKMVLAGGRSGPERRVRFLGEAEAVAALNHPGIVQVYECGVHDGQPYLTLEYCPGGSLAGKLNGTPLPPREAAALVEQLARAAHAAHACGIIHRDLKPANVLLTADGRPKVADFGLAKRTEGGSGVTQTGTILGPPSYMAPEQARGTTAIGPRADVYALGTILYECLVGRPPFCAAKPIDTVLLVLNEVPVPARRLNPQVPVNLDTVCLKCLEKDTQRRYASAAALADDLRHWLEGRPVAARPVGALERTWRWGRRNPALATALGGLLAALALGTVVSTGFGIQAGLSARDARAEAGRAREAEAVANAVIDFMSNDLLRQADSHEQADRREAVKPDLTLREALERAAGQVGDQFGGRPLAEATVRLAIGRTYAGLGEVARGTPHVERARDLRRAHLGPDHPDTLDALNTLAAVYSAGDWPSDAVPLYQEVLRLRRARLGPNHPDTLATLSNLGRCYLRIDRKGEAVPLLEEVLRLRQAQLGPDHPDTLTGLYALADAYMKIDRVPEAVLLFAESARRRQEALGPNHPLTLRSKHALARAHHLAGRPSESVPLYEQVIRLRQAVLGPDHAETLVSVHSLAFCYLDGLGRPDLAEPLFAQLLEGRRAKLGPDHTAVAAAQAYLGRARLQQNKYAEAEPLLRESVKVREQRLPNSWLLFHTQSMLGGSLTGQGKYAEAEPLLREGYEGLKQRADRLPEDNKGLLTEALERLVQLYEASGRTDEAADWKARLAASRPKPEAKP